MPDTIQSSRDTERRSVDRPSGLPIFCTERLTASESSGLARLVQAHREQADLLERAMQMGTVTGALATMMVGVRLGQIEAELSQLLGSNR